MNLFIQNIKGAENSLIKNIDGIVKNLESVENLKKDYEEKIKNLSESSYVAELEDKVKKMSATMEHSFILTDKEWEEMRNWQIKHNIDCHGADASGVISTGAAGGQFEYKFFPTGLGTFKECSCTLCKKNKNSVFEINDI